MKNVTYLLLTIAGILLLTACGADENAALTCIKEEDENNKIQLNYSFQDGKAHMLEIESTITLPDETDEEIERTDEFVLKLNDIPGCTSSITRNDETRTITEACDFNETSDSDLETFFMSRENLELSRKELIKNYAHDEELTCE